MTLSVQRALLFAAILLVDIVPGFWIADAFSGGVLAKGVTLAICAAFATGVSRHVFSKS